MPRLHAIKSFYDRRAGLVTLDDDVLSIVRQVRELYGGRVFVLLDDNTGAFHFVESSDDGSEKLIFTTDVLDARCLSRLQQADSQWWGHEDPYLALEQEQDADDAAHQTNMQENFREPLERFVHQLKHDGIEESLPLTVAVSGPMRQRGGPSA
jgi:hypothetical protein